MAFPHLLDNQNQLLQVDAQQIDPKKENDTENFVCGHRYSDSRVAVERVLRGNPDHRYSTELHQYLKEAQGTTLHTHMHMEA
jgi:CRISPR/Cas system-associated protein Csm6